MASAGRWVSAGDRISRMDIQVRSTGPGGAVQWTTIGTRLAAVEMFTGREQLESAQVLAGRGGRVTFAYDPLTAAIRPVDRLLFGTRVLEVSAVVDVEERRRQIEVTVTEQM